MPPPDGVMPSVPLFEAVIKQTSRTCASLAAMFRAMASLASVEQNRRHRTKNQHYNCLLHFFFLVCF